MSISHYSYLGIVLRANAKIKYTVDSIRCSNSSCPRHRKNLDSSERFCKHCGSPTEVFQKIEYRSFDPYEFCDEHDMEDTISFAQIGETPAWVIDEEGMSILRSSDDDSETTVVTPELISGFTEKFLNNPELTEFRDKITAAFPDSSITFNVEYGFFIA